MSDSKDTILYDGNCNFCLSIVEFIRRKDVKNIFEFHPLQSSDAKQIFKRVNERFIDLNTISW